MTTLTIIFDDKAVGQNGEFYSPIDLSAAPSGLHALQWDGSKGWIEYAIDIDGNKEANTQITELPSWVATIQNNWATAKQTKDTLDAQAIATAQSAQQEQTAATAAMMANSPIKN